MITPRQLKTWMFHVSLFCIFVNLLVKIGIIYGFEYKGILLVGCFIDFLGVFLVAYINKLR